MDYIIGGENLKKGGLVYRSHGGWWLQGNLSEARMNLLTVTIYTGMTRSTFVKACIPSTAAPPHRYYWTYTSASVSALPRDLGDNIRLVWNCNCRSRVNVTLVSN